MNKAISTALLLAAGTALANAASVYTNITNTASDSLVAAWNFDSDTDMSDGTASSWTWRNGFEHTDGSDYGTFSSASVYNSSGLGFGADAFTISFDLSNFTKSGSYSSTLLSLYTNNPNANSRSLQIVVSRTGEMSLQVGAIGSSNTNYAFGATNSRGSYVVSLGNISAISSASKTFTITSDGENICVYVDGSLADNGSLSYATDSRVVTGMQFGATMGSGGTAGSGTGLSGNIDNLAIWSTALNADQVKTLVGIPEPSAFGLLAGLGALALVAARRRRSRKAA